jgi:hypothetical protein
LTLGLSILNRIATFLDYPSVAFLNATCKGLQQFIDPPTRTPTSEEKKIIRSVFLPTPPLTDNLSLRYLPPEEIPPVKVTPPTVEEIPPTTKELPPKYVPPQQG